MLHISEILLLSLASLQLAAAHPYRDGSASDAELRAAQVARSVKQVHAAAVPIYGATRTIKVRAVPADQLEPFAAKPSASAKPSSKPKQKSSSSGFSSGSNGNKNKSSNGTKKPENSTSGKSSSSPVKKPSWTAGGSTNNDSFGSSFGNRLADNSASPGVGDIEKESTNDSKEFDESPAGTGKEEPGDLGNVTGPGSVDTTSFGDESGSGKASVGSGGSKSSGSGGSKPSSSGSGSKSSGSGSGKGKTPEKVTEQQLLDLAKAKSSYKNVTVVAICKQCITDQKNSKGGEVPKSCTACRKAVTMTPKTPSSSEKKSSSSSSSGSKSGSPSVNKPSSSSSSSKSSLE